MCYPSISHPILARNDMVDQMCLDSFHAGLDKLLAVKASARHTILLEQCESRAPIRCCKAECFLRSISLLDEGSFYWCGI